MTQKIILSGKAAAGGHKESYDVTKVVLSHPAEIIAVMHDDSDVARTLYRSVNSASALPDILEIEDSLCFFFGVNDVEQVTPLMLDRARSKFGMEGAQIRAGCIIERSHTGGMIETRLA